MTQSPKPDEDVVRLAEYIVSCTNVTCPVSPYIELETRLAREVLRLDAALSECREALKPFADASKRYDADNWKETASVDKIELLAVGDLRRAASALAKHQP